MQKYKSVLTSNEDLKKKEIIKACLRIVDRYGVKGTTIAKIAGEVGVVESALYRHFPTKKDIFVRILKEASKIFESIIIETEKLTIDPLKKLELILIEQLEFLKIYPGLTRIVYSDEIFMGDESLLSKLNDFLNRLIEKIEEIIKQGIDKKVIRSDIDVFIAAINFLGIIQLSFSYWSFKKRKVSLSLMSENLLLYFFDGIKP